ncbi:carbamoyltransferase HypF [Nitrospira sp. T9]|uniref:carbamoyltransferase HypF n=1 Tax=unclassified Nitrospira TaxID=2652172 RepID=UPI003F98192E
MMETATVSHSHGLAFKIQVSGLVQGVGFRPMVWNLAQRYDIRGQVSNNGKGLQIRVAGEKEHVRKFMADLTQHPPPLAKIADVFTCSISLDDVPETTFVIADSEHSLVETGIVPDAAPCTECVKEIFDPFARRYRYPFTNCTHCGPRLTIQEGIPYDRPSTTLKDFPLCEACLKEYHDPQDRRFHAQPIACHACGPKVWIERMDGKPLTVHSYTMLDEADAVCSLLQKGHILAIKGLGGFQLACDATREDAVSRLRALKHREGKPLALMARDLEVIRRYCVVGEREAELLQSQAAPIVILKRHPERALAPSVAPGMSTYGCMLPNSPLHHLILHRMAHPMVLTSGNHAGEPQWIDNDQAKVHLNNIAEFVVLHDRGIAQRVDDSVVKIMDQVPRVLRRSRGFAPIPIWLPSGFEHSPAILAMGGELKNTFCFLQGGQALLSHHIGDLEDSLAYADYQRAITQYQLLFEQSPEIIAVDLHPEYLSSKLGRAKANAGHLPIVEIQHHHAHLAACLAENGVPVTTEPVLGVILDGLGYGDDQTIWGGEFLLADYAGFTRVGTFKPVPMLGGTQAIKEPWRNTYAHLMAEMGWPEFAMNYSGLPVYELLEKKPRTMLDRMLHNRINSPLASSCGRLFDAAAAAMGICPERVLHEGQAPMEMEALVDEETLLHEDEALAYPFSIPRLNHSGLPYVEPLGMWQALLGDLVLKTPVPVMAARFHKGLAHVICRMVNQCVQSSDGPRRLQTVVLSGGVFQNQVLFELVKTTLETEGFMVLSHTQVPMNDGGLALGQATIAAARCLASSRGGESRCV